MPKSETQIKWSNDEVFKLLKANPKMEQCTDNTSLAEAIVAAQKRNALPAARRRDRAAVLRTLNRCDHGQSKFKEQLAAALKRYKEEGAVAPADMAAPEDKSHKSTGAIVRWRHQEWVRIAHDEEVKAMLAKPEGVGRTDMRDILVRAQRRQLASDRQRPATSIYQTLMQAGKGKNASRGAMETLREAIKYQPKEPIVSIHTPMPQYQDNVEAEDTTLQSLAHEETVRERVQRVQAAQALAAPAAHAVTPTGGLGGAIAGLIAVAIDKLKAGIIESVNAGIDAALSTALKDATVQLRDMNAQTITQLLGGPVAEQPATDLATAATQAAVKARGIRVDVVGLLNGQVEQVRKAAGDGFDLRFFTPEELDRRELTAPTTIMLANQVPHRSRHQIQSRGGKLVWANGGITGVIRELQALQH